MVWTPSATVVSEEADSWTWVDLGQGVELDSPGLSAWYTVVLAQVWLSK